MDLFQTGKKSEIPESYTAEFEEELTKLITESVDSAVEIACKDSAFQDRLESVIKHGLRLNDSKAAANFVLESCLDEIAAIMYLSSLVISGKIISEEDEIKADVFRNRKLQAFGKRISYD